MTVDIEWLADLTDLSSQKLKSPDSIILEMNRLTLPYQGVKRWNAKVFQLALKTKRLHYTVLAFRAQAGPTGLRHLNHFTCTAHLGLGQSILAWSRLA